jgi:hypothetical protein
VADKIAVVDRTSAGSLSKTQFFNLIWSAQWWAEFLFNRSPWVEHGYVPPVGTPFVLVENDSEVPDGAWILELLDTSDQEGAIGYHEDGFGVAPAKIGKHSARGLAVHPTTGKLVPVMKIFCTTARQDNVPIEEVLTHELGEAAVDPDVNTEADMRRYLDPVSKRWFLGEIGDPVQDRAVKLSQYAQSPDTGSDSLVSDIVYPAWFGQPQSRLATSLSEEFGLNPRVEPFQLSPGGYASVAPESEPTNWTPIYGEKVETPAPDPDEPKPEPVGTEGEPAPEPEVVAPEESVDPNPPLQLGSNSLTISVGTEGKGWSCVTIPIQRLAITAQPQTGTASLEPVSGKPEETCVTVVNATPEASVVVTVDVSAA